MVNKQHITVFGAIGRIGKELLQLLSQAEIPVIAVTRNKSKTEKTPFVEWIEADMGDKTSLYKTMENSKAVFVLSGPGNNFVEEQNNVIEVAQEQGVGHIVKLSSAAADKDSSFHIARVHGEVEAFLKASGAAWVILRSNGIMQNWLGEFSQTVQKERKIYEATGDGKRAYIDLRDIAEVAFNVLTNPEKYTGNTYMLTGSEAVNYDQVAGAISEAIHESVKYVPITLEEVKQQMEDAGIPEWAVQTFLAYDGDQRNGKTTIVSNAVQEILHKPARTIDVFARDYADWFK